MVSFQGNIHPVDHSVWCTKGILLIVTLQQCKLRCIYSPYCNIDWSSHNTSFRKSTYVTPINRNNLTSVWYNIDYIHIQQGLHIWIHYAEQIFMCELETIRWMQLEKICVMVVCMCFTLSYTVMEMQDPW